ncbi:uncharacterized protein YcbK (DUF882 family) [Rhizobium sp. BK650]|uniref:DUF882 domain-containing protein n=1 Tax=Rhizobium sp. BK650 TaxID=2586990 RepID=UPI0017DE7681|nr:DUF882 domain-containing protein [Rhizobium sp. BK650]MBB3655498.1 uncharacterized protein YcbK (DUF882 family) [Rhizobium sp. BK650]
MSLHQAIAAIPVTASAWFLSVVAHRMALVAALVFAVIAGSGEAAAEDRALKLFFTHTGERATIVFKRNGKYDQRGLAQINRFLRDWRRNEPARMDPRLLDLVWEVYRKSGATDTIHVVSAYRSPATNNMLRNRSRNTGVAKHSQHMLGKAMDFYIPGVKLATLRGIAMQMQVGGVGYYPTSGSPFVHLDVGNVRAWPRMSRQELARLFPDGRTIHLPADGRPLPGYQQALAQRKKGAASAPILIATNEDEDDDAPVTVRNPDPVVTGSLVTAMLPTPQRRADIGLTRQLAKPEDEVAADRGFADLASLTVPLPALRPVESEIIESEVSIPALAPVPAIAPVLASVRPAEADFTRFVVGRNPANAALVADRLTHPAPTVEQIAVLPVSASRHVSRGVGAMSARALIVWAVRSPESTVELTAPRMMGTSYPSGRGGGSPVAVSADGKGFKASRFGTDG